MLFLFLLLFLLGGAERYWISVHAGVLVRQVVTTSLIGTYVWAHIRCLLCTNITFNMMSLNLVLLCVLSYNQHDQQTSGLQTNKLPVLSCGTYSVDLNLLSPRAVTTYL